MISSEGATFNQLVLLNWGCFRGSEEKEITLPFMVSFPTEEIQLPEAYELQKPPWVIIKAFTEVTEGVTLTSFWTTKITPESFSSPILSFIVKSPSTKTTTVAPFGTLKFWSTVRFPVS